MTWSERIALALGGRRVGTQWMCRCPCHDDSRASLAVRDGADGRPLVRCHAGCPQEAVIAALRQRGLWPAADGQAKPENRETVYYYRDERGDILGQRVRVDRPGGKDVFWRRRLTRQDDVELLRAHGKRVDEARGLTWTWGRYVRDDSARCTECGRAGHRAERIREVPYLLPELLRADPGEYVFFVEGEKCADRLGVEGLVATCLPGGASAKWRDEWDQYFRGRHVVILPDNDPPGREYGRRIATALATVAASVRVVELPGLAEKEDVYDWFAAGGTKEKLLELVASTPTEVDRRLIDELAGLDRLSYDRRRQEAAEKLGVRVGTLDELVAQRRGERTLEAELDPLVEAWRVEPARDPVVVAELLEELVATVRRYVVMRDEQSLAIALWVAVAWTHDAYDVSPILFFSSPTKRCGKTRALSLLAELVPRPLPAANITAAAVFRAVEKWTPTLLIDEADTFVRERDELRGVLNSGHARRTATIVRAVPVGDTWDVRHFSTWTPKAVAAIGELPDTLTDRAIVIRLERKRPDEAVSRLDSRTSSALAPLRSRLARAAADHLGTLRHVDPILPDGLDDRAIDNWRPLLAVAELAGGDWPSRARAAALALSGGRDQDDQDVRVQLLADLQALFGELGPKIATSTILERLAAMETRPWPEWRAGKPITARQLASLLRHFGVQPRLVRLGEGVARGYDLDDFREVFPRYIPDPRSVTALHSAPGAEFRDFRSVTSGPLVTDPEAQKAAKNQHCNAVTLGNPRGEGERGYPDAPEPPDLDEEVL